MSKFTDWEDAHPNFVCSKCGELNTKAEGERLGNCPKCGNDSWERSE